MTSAYRGAWGDKNPKEFAVDSTLAVEIGDLMWWDRINKVARSAGAVAAWTGSTAGSQGKVAENFIGLARSAFVVGDMHALIRIEGRGVHRLPVTTAATFEVGDLVSASKDPSGNVLFAQQIDKVAEGAPGEPTVAGRLLAIGRVAKRYTVATNMVEVEIMGTREAGGSIRNYLTS